jgi:hypothetical protein
MYKQLEYLRESVALTLGETFRLDLPKTGMMSGFILKLQAPCTGSATLADAKWRLLDFIDKIEVIANGATVIKSLSGKHAHFLAWLHQGVVPPHFWRNYATNTQMEYIPILFGRFLGDTEYGLDLSRFDNLELRITNSSSATYHSSTITCSVLQTFVREGAGVFKGFIRSELWREWTTVSDEYQYFILPVEYPIVGLHLRALPPVTTGMSNTGFANLMDDIDLSIQGGTKKLYKGGLDDLIIQNYLERGSEVITSGLADINADRGIDVGIGRMFGWATTSGSKDGAVSAVIPTMIADATDNTISFEAREADSPVEFIARGMAYQNTGTLLHNAEMLAEAMIDPRRDGECRLNIHTRSGGTYAGGTNQVVLERLVG